MNISVLNLDALDFFCSYYIVCRGSFGLLIDQLLRCDLLNLEQLVLRSALAADGIVRSINLDARLRLVGFLLKCRRLNITSVPRPNSELTSASCSNISEVLAMADDAWPPLIS